jgi:hypothetical protein
LDGRQPSSLGGISRKIQPDAELIDGNNDASTKQ